MRFETEIIPNLSDFGRDGKLSLAGMLRIFEDLGSMHSEYVGDGILSALERGTAWVLTDWRLQTVEPVFQATRLKAVTWSEKSPSTIATNRHYLVYDSLGKLCFKGSSKWVLFDLNEQKIVRIPQELIGLYDGEEGSAFEGKLKGLRIPGEYVSEAEIVLRRSDVDFNRHVHNLRSLDFALETLPQQVYDKGEFEELRISYRQQIKEGEKLMGKYAVDGKLHYVGIYGDDGSLRSLCELREK